jgi:ribulose-phosphate 3-epimerase
MDGIFVPNISFGPAVIKSLRVRSSLFFDVHLMISEPIRYLKDFALAGADLITVHLEASQDVKRTFGR